jgi:signal-transduction protein with cAMP-binding, CBS, and nucleotidyltransferase domain
MRLVDAIGRVLHEHPVFNGLTEDEKALVAGCASLQVFPPGTYIYREDRPAENFYLIRHGRVALEVYVPARRRSSSIRSGTTTHSAGPG